jgi:hypothetical protein
MDRQLAATQLVSVAIAAALLAPALTIQDSALAGRFVHHTAPHPFDATSAARRWEISSRVPDAVPQRDPIPRSAAAEQSAVPRRAVELPPRSRAAASHALSTSTRATTAGGRHQGVRSSPYHGQNHVWIPSLGVDRALKTFPCARSRPPDAGVYRWGCAGRNNVYLMSHAWSTFKPLHDAYVGGRLRKGMKIWYADGTKRVREYSVIWWRVTAPTTAAAWAWAPQSRPSMTLQTCVGAGDRLRLMVRLVQIR